MAMLEKEFAVEESLGAASAHPVAASPGHPPASPETPALSAKELNQKLEQAAQHPKVSVVVVNRNGVDLLWNCLFALKTQTLKPLEIILVDNGSTDASVKFVRSNYPAIKVLECQDNFGWTAGFNLGAKFAKGNLVALLSNDTVVTPDWLARLVETFREKIRSAGAVTSLVKPKQTAPGVEPRPQTLNFLGYAVSGFFEDSQTVFYPAACAVLYPPLLLPEGPFDPDYSIGQQEAYLGWKLRLRGRGVYQAPRSKVFHEGDETLKNLPVWKVFFYGTRNRWLNLFLFYDPSNLWKVLPWLLMDAVFRFLKGLLTHWPSAWGTVLALAWMAAHPWTVYQKRLSLQARRKVSDGEILKCVSGRAVGDNGH